MILAKYKFNNPQMEGYVIGDDNEVYKLPYISSGRSYQLRKLEVVQMGGTKGYWFIQGRTKYWWSLRQLKALQNNGNLELITERMVLISDFEDCPFGK